jgi:hypothetical protein
MRQKWATQKNKKAKVSRSLSNFKKTFQRHSRKQGNLWLSILNILINHKKYWKSLQAIFLQERASQLSRDKMKVLKQK